MSNPVAIRLLHSAPIPNAIWCEPVGWKPANTIKGSIWVDNSWWDDYEETAGMMWFGNRQLHGPGDVIWADLDRLHVVSCQECRVLEQVELCRAPSEGDRSQEETRQ